MPKAMIIHHPGSPNALRWEESAVPEPGDAEVLIKHTAVGLNFLDIHLRNGTAPAPALPFIPGVEGCGIVIRTGKNTQYTQIGDRVAYAMGPVGAYAEYRTIPEAFLVRVPHDLAHEQVAAVLLRGLMAHTLVKRAYKVNKTTNVLVHAAAGGVGSLVCQWAKYLGAAKIIGTVGSDEKIPAAREFGCDVVINRTREDVAATVRKATDGMGAHVVYDPIGKDSITSSLDALARFGTFVSFGQMSGVVPPIDVNLLRDKGSLFFTRPSLFDYKQDFDEYHLSAAEVLDMVLRRHLRLHIMQSFQLEDAAFAHTQLESGKTQGPSVLVVGS